MGNRAIAAIQRIVITTMVVVWKIVITSQFEVPPSVVFALTGAGGARDLLFLYDQQTTDSSR